jgi:hypothetical protein
LRPKNYKVINAYSAAKRMIEFSLAFLSELFFLAAYRNFSSRSACHYFFFFHRKLLQPQTQPYFFLQPIEISMVGARVTIFAVHIFLKKVLYSFFSVCVEKFQRPGEVLLKKALFVMSLFFLRPTEISMVGALFFHLPHKIASTTNAASKSFHTSEKKVL